MRILHLTKGLKSGGVAQLVLDLASYQKLQGNDVEVISIHKVYPDYKYEGQRFENLNIKVYTINLQSYLDIRIIYKLAKKFTAYDVVHVHLFPNQLFAAIAYKLIPTKKRPVFITTEHNTWNNRREHKVLRYFDRWMYSHYDKIVAISPETEKQFRNWLPYSFLGKKVCTIYNGIEISKFKNAPNKLRETINLPKGAKTIIMVARLIHPKDPITLVRAARKIHELHVVFVGNGPLAEQIKTESNKLNISSRIHLLGTRDDVENLLKGCDIACLSTEWDGFGLVAVEYMAAGLPVVATDVPGLREVIGDPDALFPFQNADKLSERISKLLLNQPYYNDKKTYSLNRCEEFRAEIMNQKYLNLYKTLSVFK